MRTTALIALISLLATTFAHAEGDPAKGKKVFNKCIICHAVGPDAKTKIGVNLNGILGRPVAWVEGFDYSPALVGYGADGKLWDEETFRAYVADPMGFIPKGKMTFAGLKRQDEIDHLIAYLKTMDLNGNSLVAAD